MSDRYFGIDISLYQRNIDFDRVASDGVDFAIIKSSEAFFKDPFFESHYTKAKARGIKVGTYHFLRSTTKEDAVDEARFAIEECLKGKTFEFPIFVDVEASVLRTLTKKELTEVVKAFLDTIEKAGYWAGFYTNLDWYKNALEGEALASRYSFWLAYWGKTVPVDCQMWQFGGEVNLLRSNKIAGITCDQDFCFTDYPKLIAAKGLNGLKKPSASSAKTAKSSAIRVGDAVRLGVSSPVYGSSTRFQNWVYDSVLYVRELSGNRAVISTQKTGAVTGAVDVKYLTKIQ